MSTNDTVLLLANGAAGGRPLEGLDFEAFQTALHEVCGELARAIPADGEGAKHLVSIEVTGCATREAARKIARTVADSALVKTAIAGADPNWGRIVSAAGYAGVPFDPAKVELHVNGFLLYQHAAPTTFDADGRFQVDPRSSRHADRAEFLGGERADPLLDHRPDGRIRPAERGLSHVG